MSQKIKVIIINSRVLVSSDEEEICEALKKWSPLSPQELREKIFKSPKIAMFERGEIPPQTFYSIIMSMISAMEKKPSFTEFHGIWGNTFIPRDGVENIVKRLLNLESVYLIANTDVIRWDYLEKIPTINILFDGPGKFILSHLNKCRIPEIALYLKAIRQTNCDGPERKHILYVDTNPQNTDAFSRLGAISLLYNPQERPDIFIKALRSYGVL